MLYRILYYLFRLTVNGYFRYIYIKGKENIPNKGPVIFAPNHTSAFMDPILLATEIRRSIYFLARGDVFKRPIVAKFLSLIHMIPIYRKDESPEDTHKNEGVFEKCFEHLAKGGTIMIFPEGVSKTERRLRPIKTGTARIALGTEAQHNFQSGVKIVPIGINYSNPHSFRSDVFVNFGEPIDVDTYKQRYEQDEKAAVIELTNQLKGELEKRVIIIEDERLDRIIKQIEILYRSKLRANSDPNEKAPQDFYLSKEIVNAVNFHLKKDPKRLSDFEVKLSAYLSGLKKLGIRDTQVRSTQVSLNLFWNLLFFTLGFPVFLFGFLFNYIPFKLAGWVVRKFEIREDFVGSVRMAGGMVIFLIAYLVEATLIALLLNFWWALGFILLLYPTGLFTINYIKHYYQLRGTLKYVQLFMRKSNLIAKVKVTREELVAELEKGREEYMAATSQS